MELFIAICHDRHIDTVVRVFSSLEPAIQYCMDFVDDRAYEIEESQPGDRWWSDEWAYHATYGAEGECVVVEKGVLDPPEYGKE